MTATDGKQAEGAAVALKRSTWLLELKAKYAEEWAEKLREELREAGNPVYHRNHSPIKKAERRAAALRQELEESKDLPCCLLPRLSYGCMPGLQGEKLICSTCGAFADPDDKDRIQWDGQVKPEFLR